MVNQVPIIPCKSPDTHEQYYGFSTDQLQPWKIHNIARESQVREIFTVSLLESRHGGNLNVNTYPDTCLG